MASTSAHCSSLPALQISASKNADHTGMPSTLGVLKRAGLAGENETGELGITPGVAKLAVDAV